MKDVTASLNGNVLKLSAVTDGSFKGVSAELESLEADAISGSILELIPQITSQPKRKISLSFIVEPKDVVFKFITVSKQDNDLEEFIFSEIRSKLEGFALEDLYFSYHKIAPFIYQFVGIKKAELEKYLTISNNAGLQLKSVVPWVLALPNAARINDPAIFLSKSDDRQVVVLSEFGNIFFTASYDTDKSAKELEELVQELSVYKRKNPISRIYTFMYDGVHLDPSYQITRVEIPNVGEEATAGYEFHLLVNYVSDSNPDFLYSQLNLLTLLPVPVAVDKKPVPAAYVGVAVASLVLLAGIVGGAGYFRNRSVPLENSDVLSEVSESTQSQAPQQQQQPSALNKSDLVIRIENGAGIAGIASRTQTFLEEKGYTIEDMGNAEEIGRETTLLKFKSDKVQYKDLLSEDMKDQFSVVIEENLDPSVTYDVLVVIGTDAQI